jgi:formate C-acetyltransferase
LNGYRRRIQSQLEKNPAPESQELYQSLLTVIDAAKIIQRRLLDRLKSTPAEGESLNRQIKLMDALSRVPFEPARSFYEAMVSLNFLFYFEGPDSPGRMDQYLWDFYQHDRSAGLITDDEVLELLNEFFQNMDNVCGWNVTIGGTKGPDGQSAVNELTYLIMEASKGRRRPNLALRIPEQAEDRLWDRTFDMLATGNGLPALYNDREYVNALRTYGLGLNETDLHDISYGGCTETMIQGCSNIGSLASTFHMLKVLEDTIRDWLNKVPTFEAFLAKYFEALETEAQANCDEISKSNESRARFYPQLIRTLLTDDCIDTGREFRAGGARYNWDTVGLEGFSNVIDSLIVLKQLVFEEGFITGEKFQEVLGANFNGSEDLLARINRLPKYGQGNIQVDAFAAKIATFTFDQFKKRCGWGQRKYLASCLMFVTYADRGKIVGATPDGRLAGAPLGDSFGAYQGRDNRGPTALINSVTGFSHKDAPGTLVINVRLTKDMLTEPATRKKIRSLVETYFSRGGMQIQINVVDQKILEDAIKHPEKHGNLIIRIGGYSEYFNNLSEDLKQSVLERTIHGV